MIWMPFIISFLVLFVVIMVAVTVASKFWDCQAQEAGQLHAENCRGRKGQSKYPSAIC